MLTWLSDWLPQGAFFYVSKKAAQAEIEEIDDEIK